MYTFNHTDNANSSFHIGCFFISDRRQSVLICISLICKAQDTVSSLMMHLSWICYIHWWFNAFRAL